MKDFFYFFLRAIPFTIGLILCLISLTYLVQFTSHSYSAEETLYMFIGLAAVGIPTILFGISRLSSETAL